MEVLNAFNYSRLAPIKLLGYGDTFWKFRKSVLHTLQASKDEDSYCNVGLSCIKFYKLYFIPSSPKVREGFGLWSSGSIFHLLFIFLSAVVQTLTGVFRVLALDYIIYVVSHNPQAVS